MPKAVEGGEMIERFAREWPVFKEMRGQKQFQDVFKKVFGKDLISVAPLTSDALPATPAPADLKEAPIEKGSKTRH